MLNIKQRQMNLQFLGYYKLKIDGIEGDQIIQAYKDFQRDYNLIVDGIYGPQTDTKLIEVIKSEQAKLGVKQDGVAGPITINAKNKNYQCKYFKDSEFTCKCGCGTNLQTYEIKVIADKIREHFGKPAIINSGTRCIEHNKRVQGVPNSRHTSGKAIDIYVTGVTGNDLLKYCQSLVNKGEARYTYFIAGTAVHIDVV